MFAIDRFIEAAEDARLAVVAVALVLGWPSTRGLTVPEIAEQLGVSTSTITRACARFRRRRSTVRANLIILKLQKGIARARLTA